MNAGTQTFCSTCLMMLFFPFLAVYVKTSTVRQRSDGKRRFTSPRFAPSIQRPSNAAQPSFALGSEAYATADLFMKRNKGSRRNI